MMNTKPNYYTPSGRIAWHAPVKLVVYGSLSAMVLAALYAVVVCYNPVVYFSFLATLGFGAGLAVAASSVTEAGHSRSRGFNVFAGLFVGLVGWWAHWLVWTYLVYEDGMKSVANLAFSGPSGWAAFLEFTAQNLHVSIGRLGRSHAEASSGFMLWVWGLEAVLIIGIPLWVNWSGVSQTPYAETLGQWAKTEWEGELDVPADVALDHAALKACIERDGPMHMLAWPLATAVTPEADAPAWTTVQLTCISVAHDLQSRWISLKALTHEPKVDSKGAVKVSKKTTNVLSNLQLDAVVYGQLLAHLKALPEPAA